MAKRTTLEKAVGVLESMYVAHLAKIDGDAQAARIFGRMKTPECREKAKLLRDAAKERGLAADALGTAIDALRETLETSAGGGMPKSLAAFLDGLRDGTRVSVAVTRGGRTVAACGKGVFRQRDKTVGLGWKIDAPGGGVFFVTPQDDVRLFYEKGKAPHIKLLFPVGKKGCKSSAGEVRHA